jgi:hypothetical protein
MVAQVLTGIHSRDLEIKEDEDGESRVLDAELVLNFSIKVFGQEELSLLTDFYSTKEICQPVYEDGYFENLILQNKSKARIGGKIPIVGRTPLQIWNVSGELRIDRKEQKENGIWMEGAVYSTRRTMIKCRLPRQKALFHLNTGLRWRASGRTAMSGFTARLSR